MIALITLDALEKLWYAPESTPFEAPLCEEGVVTLRLRPGFRPALFSMSLNGDWKMTESSCPDWENAYPAQIPTTVYKTLMDAGVIPDIYLEKNVELARPYCFKSWSFHRAFTLDRALKRAKLSFSGVANVCRVILDGELLGSHEGAFGGPDFVLENLQAGEHLLELQLEAIPDEPYFSPTDPEDSMIYSEEPIIREECLHTVTPLINYGWHYVNLPSFGIWRDVTLEEVLPTELSVFAAACDLAHAQRGEIDISVDMEHLVPDEHGCLSGEIHPVNFDTKPIHFDVPVTAKKEKQTFHLRMRIPEARMWWPIGYGEQNLYRMELRYDTVRGTQGFAEVRFALRTIEMEPVRLPCANNWVYAWKFVVNGVPFPVHGQNWGMMDSASETTRSDYRRMLLLAKNSHCNMLRIWGNGVVEQDFVYDLCDELGILVFQEWPLSAPTCATRSYTQLYEMVVRNMRMLRNHPSIAIWCGGNELDYQTDSPCNAILRMMGRLSYELDGTRPFHLSEDWGGSYHCYPVFWNKQPLERSLDLRTVFLGEFGLAATPCLDTVLHYLPEQERGIWPLPKDSAFRYHFPMFGNNEDYERIERYVAECAPLDSLEHFCMGSQLGQVIAVRHNCEFQRCGWPDRCTGVLHYKLNEMYPAVSWGAVDYYGVPRMVYYFMQDVFRPQHACLLFQRLECYGEAISLPVHLLDDTGALGEWKVTVSAWNEELKLVTQNVWSGVGAKNGSERIAVLKLTEEQTRSTPLLLHVRLDMPEGSHSTFYWMNFAKKPGCMLTLPRTELQTRWEDGRATVKNTGAVPAVGVHFLGWEALRETIMSDSFFWLDPGEETTVCYEYAGGLPALRTAALNVD